MFTGPLEFPFKFGLKDRLQREQRTSSREGVFDGVDDADRAGLDRPDVDTLPFGSCAIDDEEGRLGR